MEKTLLAAITGSILLSANADNATVPSDGMFIGAASNKTCDVELRFEVAAANAVNLGSIAVSSTGDTKPLTIIAKIQLIVDVPRSQPTAGYAAVDLVG